METPAPAAPAQPPAAPTTVSASIDAVNRSDFDAFDQAELAKRTGAPVADVPVVESDDAEPVVAAPASTDGRTISARQQKTNDAIREAVTRATKETADRIALLERELAARPAVPRQPAAEVAPVAPAPKTPEYKRIMALPGAPKLADFDSVEEHAFAAAAFALETTSQERATQERRQAAAHTRAEQEAIRFESFGKQIHEAKTADPTFATQLTPEVQALEGFGALAAKNQERIARGEVPLPGGPLNFITEQIYDSPIVKDVLLHFSQHPDELARLAAGPAQIAHIPPAQRTDAQAKQHMRWMEHEFKRLEGRLAGHGTTETTAAAAVPVPAPRSPITAAPPPLPTLRAAGSTSDPKASALAREDFEEYDRLVLQERVAKLAPR